jgi:serine/threonine protein kinase
MKEAYSLKADVWSFGVVLWEILSWAHPWEEYAIFWAMLVKSTY